MPGPPKEPVPNSPTGTARLVLAVIVAASLLPVSAGQVAAPVRAGTGAIPDLAVAPLTDFRIETVGGQRLLRFTSTMVNIGDGHFELRGHRANTSQPMAMEQWIWTDHTRSTPSAIMATPAVAMWSGDGHSHWHVQEMMRFDLWDGTTTARGAKIGFCFLDTDPYDPSLPGYPPNGFYPGSGCGNSPNALGIQMGMSIGWGDKYAWSLPFQWVDITGLPTGTYTVRARADPNGFFVETDDILNQCAFATVSISTGSNAVSVFETGSACVNDWSASGFAADIAWLFESGITTGCAPELFCPVRTVSRQEMASFFARARGLVPMGPDWFTDDESSIHEPDINAIADEGITKGCAPGLYCPASPITREQMASFLVRALGLTPDETNDWFTDDEGSIHEADINALRTEGITFGCSPGLFCPSGLVTREQMAAFLHRAFD